MILIKKADIEGEDNLFDVTLEGTTLELAHETCNILISFYGKMKEALTRGEAKAVMSTIFAAVLNSGAYCSGFGGTEEASSDMAEAMEWALTQSRNIVLDSEEEYSPEDDPAFFEHDNIKIVKGEKGRYLS